MPDDYERTEQGDDPSCPSDRLTDEEAREIMGYHPDPRVKDTLAELLALRARVAKLEAALKEIASRWRFSNSDELGDIAADALKDAP